MQPNQEGQHEIQFFIDPAQGIMYTQKDVDIYLRKINAPKDETYFTPINTKRIIYKMMEELSLCYQYNHENNKAGEIKQLMDLIKVG